MGGGRTATEPSTRRASEQIAKALGPPPDGSTAVMIEWMGGVVTSGRSRKAMMCGSLKARTVSSALIPILSLTTHTQ
jgi:hypothetical protein